jgi:hypothetical protein
MGRSIASALGSSRMRFIVIAVTFVLAVAILTSRSTTHIPPNPGPSGTPGSTLLAEPPPAGGPSHTTGMAR